jgi:transposase
MVQKIAFSRIFEVDSSNGRSELAQRGKNKQKRMDLRQVGLACLVSRKEQLPLFHYTFRGNKPDVTIFKEILNRLNERLAVLTDVERVTLVFDKGNNSKKNLSDLKQTGLHYVGSLTPAYHKKLLQQANQHWQVVKIKNKDISVYRTREEIWGETRTIIVYISERLRQGQIRGIRQIVAKKFKTLEQLQNGLQKRNKKSTRQQIRSRIEKVLQGQYIAQVVVWNLQKRSGNWDLSYRLDEDKLRELSESYLGRRILMTNRHDWNAEEIILAYWSQSHVECAFRRMKNPYHGAFRPQFHWTDQKIQVHAFLCVLAYLLTMVAFLKAKQNGYAGSVATLMEQLRSIRLAALIEQKHGQRGKMKINYRLEEIPEELVKVVDALKIASSNLRSTINVGVYT